MNPVERQGEGCTEPFPGHGRAQHKPRLHRRHPEGFREGNGREGCGAEQFGQLTTGIGPPLPEGRAVALCPQAAAGGHHGKDAATRREHAPDLRETGERIIRHLKGMNHQHAIGHGIGERKVGLVDQRALSRPCRRPVDDTLPCRHEGKGALGIFTEQAKIGRAIAKPHQGHAPRARPMAMDGAVDHAARDLPEGAPIEGTEINHVGQMQLRERRGHTVPVRLAACNGDGPRDNRDCDPYLRGPV